MTNTYDNTPEIALAWLAEGKAVALATVIETWGSAPRPVGSQLVISGEAEIMGSVSGGCVEAAVVEEALEALEEALNDPDNDIGIPEAALHPDNCPINISATGEKVSNSTDWGYYEDNYGEDDWDDDDNDKALHGNQCKGSIIRYGPQCGVRQGIHCKTRQGNNCRTDQGKKAQPNRLGTNCRTRIGMQCRPRLGVQCISRTGTQCK